MNDDDRFLELQKMRAQALHRAINKAVDVVAAELTASGISSKAVFVFATNLVVDDAATNSAAVDGKGVYAGAVSRGCKFCAAVAAQAVLRTGTLQKNLAETIALGHSEECFGEETRH